MGAEFNYYVYKGDKSKLEDYHREEQQDQCLQFGNDSYAGHIGVMPSGIDFVKRKPFASASEAREYLEEHHSKWDYAMAVPYQTIGETFSQASFKLMDRRDKVQKEFKELDKNIMLSIKGTKSKTIGCKSCGSSIVRAFLLSPQCPVCGKYDVFYSKTQGDQLDRKRAQLNRLNAKPLTSTKGKVIHYVVGGWCAL